MRIRTTPLVVALIFLPSALARGQDDHLQLCEVAVRPGPAEFIEIYNPTDGDVSLDNYYLADHYAYAELPAGAPSLHGSDFIARFPPGHLLGPCEVKVIALHGPDFHTNYDRAADFEIKTRAGDDPDAENMILIRGGSSSTGFSDGGEMVVLFHWDGESDLVDDIDMLRLGDPEDAANDLADKRDLWVDGPDPDTDATRYKDDLLTMPRAASTPGNDRSVKRILLEAGDPFEPGDDESSGPGNGLAGDDETSENILVTWDIDFDDVGADPWICRPAPQCRYRGLDATSKATLSGPLHELIDDHVWFSYDGRSWEILTYADEDPNDPTKVLDFYKNASYPKSPHTGYDREHTWPKTYGFKEPTKDAEGEGNPKHNYPYSDCHHLVIADSSYNQTGRNHRLYAFCDPAIEPSCVPWITVANDGRGGETGSYAADSNWQGGTGIDGAGPDGSWETWGGRRGDVARAQFYLALRYEGDRHSVTDSLEPNLELSNLRAEIAAHKSSTNQDHAYMGLLADLLEWHRSDPPDWREARRNDRVSFYQRNRNPFIDHPEWVGCLFSDLPGACLATSADLSVTKNGSEEEVAPGDEVTYTLEVTNAGPDDATWVRVLDPLDCDLFDPLAVTWTCAAGGGAGTHCPAAGGGRDLLAGVYVAVESGDSVVFTLSAEVRPEATGLVVNTASLALPVGLVDADAAGNTASETTLLTGDCGSPFVLPLEGTVDWIATFIACDAIYVTDLVVEAPGDATLRAGQLVVFGNGFRVDEGCPLTVEIDPSLAAR